MVLQRYRAKQVPRLLHVSHEEASRASPARRAED